MAEDFATYNHPPSDRYYGDVVTLKDERRQETKEINGQIVTTTYESRVVRTNGTERLGKEAKEILLDLIARIREKLLGVVEGTEAVAAVVPRMIQVYAKPKHA